MTRNPQSWTIEDIREANARAGKFFFSPATMRFFRSRIGRKVYQTPEGARVAFVTSEQFDDQSPRLYSARSFNPETGETDGIGPFNKLTKREATRLALLYCAGEVPARDEGEGLGDYEARVAALVTG